MDASEYANIEALERVHWYYVGKRELVRFWIGRLFPLSRRHTLLDCGAGTGLFATEMSGTCRVLVLDDHEESLSRLRARFPADQVLRVSATGIPLPVSAVDVITALDVLEHIKDDSGAVREMARVLRSGGLLVATVPASMSLWSDWDETLHHFRRYDRARLQALFAGSEWEVLHVNYTNVPVFPAVWLIRKWRRIARRRKSGGDESVSRSEDQLPPRWLNAILRWVFVRLGKSRLPFPFGVSLLLVARKR